MVPSMFDKLLTLFNAPEPESFNCDDDDSEIALAVLLVRVGRVDNNYTPEEQSRIDGVLSNFFNLTNEEAAGLRGRAEILEADALDSVRFTKALKDSVPIDEREHLLERLWEIVLCDDTRDYREDGYLRLVSKLLGVSDRDSAFARRRALARLQ